jgi:hypothetical protein
VPTNAPIPSVKDWPCPNCGFAIGRIMRNNLVVAKHTRFNTSGPCVVVTCSKCGTPKTWFPPLESIMTYLAELFARDFTKYIVKQQANVPANGDVAQEPAAVPEAKLL